MCSDTIWDYYYPNPNPNGSSIEGFTTRNMSDENLMQRDIWHFKVNVNSKRGKPTESADMEPLAAVGSLHRWLSF